MPQHQYLDPHILAHLPKHIELIAKRLVQGLFVGYHRSPYFGSSVEFADHRQYYPGDELRTMDWRVWAKHDRYCIKRFMMESQLKATILLDCSTSMDFRSDGLSKLEYGCYLAASLCYLIIHQNDMAGLVSFDDSIRDYLPPRGSRVHMRSILHALERLKTGRQTNVARICHHLAETMRARGMVIVISDLLDEPDEIIRGLRHLRSARHDIIVFQLLDNAELTLPYRELSDFEDMEAGGSTPVDPIGFRQDYISRIEEFCARLREGCVHSNIDYVRVNTSEPIEKMLFNYLVFRARHSR